MVLFKLINSKNYKVPDTIHGMKNSKVIREWIINNNRDVDLEIKNLKKWLATKEFSFHAWKIKHNDWT